MDNDIFNSSYIADDNLWNLLVELKGLELTKIEEKKKRNSN
jgi:hypothetical protein